MNSKQKKKTKQTNKQKKKERSSLPHQFTFRGSGYMIKKKDSANKPELKKN